MRRGGEVRKEGKSVREAGKGERNSDHMICGEGEL